MRSKTASLKEEDRDEAEEEDDDDDEDGERSYMPPIRV